MEQPDETAPAFYMQWELQSESNCRVFIPKFEVLRSKVWRNRPKRSCKNFSRLDDWADLVFVMSEKEDGHLTFIESNFSLKDKLVCDLDISDNYDRDDPELVGLLRKKVEEFLLLQGYPPAS
jgi:hypothetical protein